LGFEGSKFLEEGEGGGKEAARRKGSRKIKN
jgi:hypothetical protein